MSTREFFPSNTEDIEIPYSAPATQTVTRDVTWIKPDTDTYEMTGLSVAFTTSYGGYVVGVTQGGTAVHTWSSTNAQNGDYAFELPEEVWDEAATGTLTLAFRRPSSNRQTYANVRLIVTYQAKEPEPGPEPPPVEPRYIAPKLQTTGRRQAIRVLSQWETGFTNMSDASMALGEGTLTPTECTVTEEAGGQYSLSLTHPIDAAGKWRLITPFALIVAPIPRTDTPFIDQSSNMIIGEGMEAWAASTASTGFYERKTPVAYRPWKNGEGYAPGDRVSYQLWNWECKMYTLLPPAEGASWKKLNRVDPQPVSTIPQGELFLVSETEELSGVTWLTVTRLDGSTGYAKASECEYMYTPGAGDSLLDDIPARELTHQVFRVMDVTINSQNFTVKASAMHVSYDWSMAITGKINLKDTPLVTAISAIRTAMLPGGVSTAPHIYAENTSSNITCNVTRKALTNILLDPDEGLVPQAKARLVRDGYDFFLLRNDPGDRTTRGMVIRYGVNLRGVTWRRDYSKLVTRVLPIAKDEDGEEYLLPETADETWPYVDSSLRSSYPVDMYQVIQVDAQISEEMTEAEVQQKMVEEAEKVYLDEESDKPDVTLTVDFLQLGDTAEYAQYRGLERVTLYDVVEIDHPDIGLTTSTQVTGYEWDAIRCRYNKITLGKVFGAPQRTVYGYGIADGEIGIRKLTPEAIEAIRNG